MHIFINSERLITITKKGKFRLYITEKNTFFKIDIKLIEIECYQCYNKNIIKDLYWYNKKPRLCKHCKASKENNGFYGKHHTSATIEKIKNKPKLYGSKNPMFNKTVKDIWIEKYGLEEANKKEKLRNAKMSNHSLGENNSFYGKSHTQESRKKIGIKSKERYENLTDAQQEQIKQRMIIIQRKQKLKNYKKYIEDKKKANAISLQSQARYNINQIEKFVQIELGNRHLDFKYSVILDKYQFDFGNKEYRILLEVHGDYWHGNPDIYTKLDQRQLKNQTRDLKKLEFCKKHNFKLFVIWETDIKNNNFEILDQIKAYIHEIQIDTNH